MKINRKNITGLLFLAILSIGMVGSIILTDKTVSYGERRYLKKLPQASVDKVLDGSYMADLDYYFLDHFIGRDIFRTIKAEFDLWCLGKMDSNGYYLQGNHVFEIQTTTNMNNVEKAGEKFQGMVDKYFTDANVYYSLIPGKSYEFSRIPQLDFEGIEDIMAQTFVDGIYIDISDSMELNMYYDTDLHWKQEEITEIATEILVAMNAKSDQDIWYDEKVVTTQFLGGYGASSAYYVQKDTLSYLTNEMLENCVVYDYEEQKEMEMYPLDKVQGMDPYDLFLGGAKALITIENNMAKEERELLLFRDSFGSSIAPLLVEGYSKITIIDLRYVTLDYAITLLGDSAYDDVLFLYNTLLLHNSHSMKF